MKKKKLTKKQMEQRKAEIVELLYFCFSHTRGVKKETIVLGLEELEKGKTQ